MDGEKPPQYIRSCNHNKSFLMFPTCLCILFRWTFHWRNCQLSSVTHHSSYLRAINHSKLIDSLKCSHTRSQYNEGLNQSSFQISPALVAGLKIKLFAAYSMNGVQLNPRNNRQYRCFHAKWEIQFKHYTHASGWFLFSKLLSKSSV